MSTFIQFIITGLRLGSVYALIALGYTMVYGIIKLINFAHGDFIMVGGYTLYFVIPIMMALGLPGWTAVIFAIVVCACVGMLVELLAYRPVRKRGSNLTALITAIAMSFVLENLAQAIPAIGRAMMTNPKILLMDEPSMGLSPLLVSEIFAIIEELHKDDITILLVEQNANMALSIADRAYVLENGRITMSGDAKELLTDERIKKAYLGA